MSTEMHERTNFVPQAPTGSTNLLESIRRIYFYLIASVSLLVGLSGFLSLLDILCEVWIGDVGVSANTASYVRNIVARGGGMLLVATPIFLIHWLFIQRHRHERQEASSAIRKFFLYLISAITLGLGASLALELVAGVTELLLGAPTKSSNLWPSQWLFLMLAIPINGLLFLYFRHQLRGDGDWGVEEGWAGTWRRLYQVAFGLAGLGLLIAGLEILFETLWQVILPADPGRVEAYWQRGRVSMGFAMLVIGALLWRTNWLSWQRIIHANPQEARTAFRRLYLYVSVIIGAVVTLVPAAVLLRQLLLELFHVSGSASATSSDLAIPLAFLPIGLVIWVWHWRYIQREAADYGDTPESTLVRRIYYYAVAAVGLILTWFGLVDILRVLLDLVTPATTVLSGPFWAEQLANGLSLLAVCAPVWAGHWRTVQSVARQPDAVGEAERSSWPRRLYLYIVALAGALIALFYLSLVVYGFLLLLLGDPQVDVFGTEAIDALVRSIVTLVFWVVHVLAIRRDSQLQAEEQSLPVKKTDTAVPLMDATARAAQLELTIQRLEAELAAAHAELAALQQTE